MSRHTLSDLFDILLSMTDWNDKEEALLMVDNKIAQQAKEFFSEENTDLCNWQTFYDLNVLVQDHIMNDPEYVINILRDSENFEFTSAGFEDFPKKIRDNLDVMKVAVELAPSSIEYISEDSINSELFTIIFDEWKNEDIDESDASVVLVELAISSCNEDRDLIKHLIEEISSWGVATSLPFGLIYACSSTLFKDKDILLGLLKNFNEEVNGFLCETGSNKIYGGDSFYLHWTEIISCEDFSKKMQGSSLLEDPDVINLIKNISTGIEKHFTLMHKENQMMWINNNEDKDWIKLFRELSKG